LRWLAFRTMSSVQLEPVQASAMLLWMHPLGLLQV
jgi:hypothetical protein